MPASSRKFGYPLFRVGIAIAGAAVAAMTEGPWAIAGALAAISVLTITLLDIWFRWKRRRILRAPCDTNFEINGHHIKCITVPPYKSIPVRIFIHPNITFDAERITINFNNKHRLLYEPPEIVQHVDISTKLGLTEDPAYRLDKNGTYHILSPTSFTKGVPFIFGVVIETGVVGRYTANIIYRSSEGVLGTTQQLLLIVKDDAKIDNERCHRHRQCRLNFAYNPSELTDVQIPRQPL
jgi:hypothetical protein